MLAHVGMCVPSAVADGVGDGLASADGDAMRGADAVGDVLTAAALVDPQAVATIKRTSASSPTLRLTRRWNEAGWTGVTRRPADTGAQGYGQQPPEPLAERQAVLRAQRGDARGVKLEAVAGGDRSDLLGLRPAA